MNRWVIKQLSGCVHLHSLCRSSFSIANIKSICLNRVKTLPLWNWDWCWKQSDWWGTYLNRSFFCKELVQHRWEDKGGLAGIPSHWSGLYIGTRRWGPQIPPINLSLTLFFFFFLPLWDLIASLVKRLAFPPPSHLIQYSSMSLPLHRIPTIERNYGGKLKFWWTYSILYYRIYCNFTIRKHWFKQFKRFRWGARFSAVEA